MTFRVFAAYVSLADLLNQVSINRSIGDMKLVRHQVIIEGDLHDRELRVWRFSHIFFSGAV